MKHFNGKILSFLLILCLVIAPDVWGQEKTQNKLQCSAPAYLKPGDKVALISPSYYSKMTTVDKTVKVLRNWGYKPVVGPNVGKAYQYKYAGTPEERMADLRWALNDPEIKAIICDRGGYGTLHLVDEQLLKEMAASPKWIVGYSDITTLLSMENCAGVMGIHSVMGCNLAARGGKDLSCTLLRDLLRGKIPQYELPAHDLNIPGKATGILVGGNLATIAPLLSSQANTLANNDIIIFMEEVEESMHSVDRLVNMMIMSGVMSRCKGIILGNFTDCIFDLGYESFEAMIREYIAPYNIPLLCGFPAGHERVNLPLVMGAPVTIDVRNDGATLSFDIEGAKRPVHINELKEPETIKPEYDSREFVNLTEVIPDAILEIRYFGTYNFVGERIDGYQQPTALMTKRAADSLKVVSDEVMRMGYRLKIYDAYRPQMAVDHFVRWASDIDDTLMRRYFYPSVDKSLLFEQNYIAAKSGHTRGSTVDLTLFDMNTEKELDMGGTFDWFGVESHPDYGGDPEAGKYNGNGKITEEQFHNRMILREVMLRHGFKPVDSEWWHFTLKNEPFPDTYFEFPVEQIK